jgi:hypothetical protein
MATNYFGLRSTANPILSGAGLLHGVTISHNQASVQSCTIYDNTAASGTILIIFNIAPEHNPFHLMLPRRYAIPFTTGLSATHPNCQLNLWATIL